MTAYQLVSLSHVHCGIWTGHAFPSSDVLLLLLTNVQTLTVYMDQVLRVTINNQTFMLTLCYNNQFAVTLRQSIPTVPKVVMGLIVPLTGSVSRY